MRSMSPENEKNSRISLSSTRSDKFATRIVLVCEGIHKTTGEAKRFKHKDEQEKKLEEIKN